jgi:hypothetical protein
MCRVGYTGSIPQFHKHGRRAEHSCNFPSFRPLRLLRRVLLSHQPPPLYCNPVGARGLAVICSAQTTTNVDRLETTLSPWIVQVVRGASADDLCVCVMEHRTTVL